jgi:hypothetical protein
VKTPDEPKKKIPENKNLSTILHILKSSSSLTPSKDSLSENIPPPSSSLLKFSESTPQQIPKKQATKSQPPSPTASPSVTPIKKDLSVYERGKSAPNPNDIKKRSSFSFFKEKTSDDRFQILLNELKLFNNNLTPIIETEHKALDEIEQEQSVPSKIFQANRLALSDTLLLLKKYQALLLTLSGITYYPLSLRAVKGTPVLHKKDECTKHIPLFKYQETEKDALFVSLIPEKILQPKSLQIISKTTLPVIIHDIGKKHFWILGLDEKQNISLKQLIGENTYKAFSTLDFTHRTTHTLMVTDPKKIPENDEEITEDPIILLKEGAKVTVFCKTAEEIHVTKKTFDFKDRKDILDRFSEKESWDKNFIKEIKAICSFSSYKPDTLVSWEVFKEIHSQKAHFCPPDLHAPDTWEEKMISFIKAQKGKYDNEFKKKFIPLYSEFSNEIENNSKASLDAYSKEGGKKSTQIKIDAMHPYVMFKFYIEKYHINFEKIDLSTFLDELSELIRKNYENYLLTHKELESKISQEKELFQKKDQERNKIVGTKVQGIDQLLAKTRFLKEILLKALLQTEIHLKELPQQEISRKEILLKELEKKIEYSADEIFSISCELKWDDLALYLLEPKDILNLKYKNSEGRPGMYYLVKFGKLNILERLCIRYPFDFSPDIETSDGESLMTTSVLLNQVFIAKFFIERCKAKVDIINLLKATDSPELTELLLMHSKSQINSSLEKGFSPLVYWILAGKLDLIPIYQKHQVLLSQEDFDIISDKLSSVSETLSKFYQKLIEHYPHDLGYMKNLELPNLKSPTIKL